MALDDYNLTLFEIAREISVYLQKGGVSQSDADDVVQDLLVKLLEGQLILPLDKLRAWMYRTAIRTYIDKYRRDVKYQDILRREFFTQETLTPFDGADYSDLETALEQVSKAHRLVIDLYYFQQFSIKEIAQLLGIRQASVKMRLSRTRKQLKKRLTKGQQLP